MSARSFSYELERDYYSRAWPVRARPYLHLDPYLRCWLDPEQIFRDKRVLDVGAGECTYTRLIADTFEPARVVACELFPARMLPAARANRNARLEFVAGDCFRLPFRDGSFDVVFGSFILHQLPDLEATAGEIRRVLADGGVYVGIEPNPRHPLHLARYLRGRHSANQYLLGPRHLATLERLGFAISHRYFYGRAPRLRSRLVGTCMGILARLPEERLEEGASTRAPALVGMSGAEEALR